MLANHYSPMAANSAWWPEHYSNIICFALFTNTHIQWFAYIVHVISINDNEWKVERDRHTDRQTELSHYWDRESVRLREEILSFLIWTWWQKWKCERGGVCCVCIEPGTLISHEVKWLMRWFLVMSIIIITVIFFPLPDTNLFVAYGWDDKTWVTCR